MRRYEEAFDPREYYLSSQIYGKNGRSTAEARRMYVHLEAAGKTLPLGSTEGSNFGHKDPPPPLHTQATLKESLKNKNHSASFLYLVEIAVSALA
jgi:hypothetical protein